MTLKTKYIKSVLVILHICTFCIGLHSASLPDDDDYDSMTFDELCEKPISDKDQKVLKEFAIRNEETQLKKKQMRKKRFTKPN